VKKRAKKKWDHETQTPDDFAAILYGEIREHIGRDYNVSVVNRRHVEVMNVRTANSFFWDVPWPTTLEIMEASIGNKTS
jgi:hypothetical protein